MAGRFVHEEEGLFIAAKVNDNLFEYNARVQRLEV